MKREKKKNKPPRLVSKDADAFVGNAITKNFQPETGRFATLLTLGSHFREHRQTQESVRNLSTLDSLPYTGSLLILTPEEELPAYHLGCLTRPGALVSRTFDRTPHEPVVMNKIMETQYWQTVLSQAVNGINTLNCNNNNNNNNNNNTSLPLSHRLPMAYKRLWTCGLADAGLHNLFLSQDRIWFFDLGEPQLTSVPGFLTKVLFSFFHTLGMEELPSTSGADGGGGHWVRRFQVNSRTEKLCLTRNTCHLLNDAYRGFEQALNGFVTELFCGDMTVRWLLVQYVTLQLISDASFCLQKWTLKGGGRRRDMNHHECLEKWLWRALWDIYVACDLNSTSMLNRLKVQNPRPTACMGGLATSVNSEQKENVLQLIQELALEVPKGHGVPQEECSAATTAANVHQKPIFTKENRQESYIQKCFYKLLNPKA